MNVWKIIPAIFSALVLQWSLILPCAEAAPCPPTQHCSCCDTPASCPCLKESKPKESPAPANVEIKPVRVVASMPPSQWLPVAAMGEWNASLTSGHDADRIDAFDGADRQVVFCRWLI